MGVYDEPIVPECKNCGHIMKKWGADDKKYCSYHPYPKTQWWYEQVCPDATFTEKKADYDPADEGRYDSRGRVNKPTSKNKI